MAGWRVSLRGQELEVLMQSMAGDPDWSMARDPGGYYLTPKRVFHEGGGRDVHMAAESWVTSINLVSRLISPNFQIGFTVEYIKDDGAKLHVVFHHEFAIASDLVGTEAVIGPDGKPVQAQIPPIASMARTMARAKVAEAVRLFHARRDDWTQLCNVIQMVRNDLGTDIPRTWVSHTKLELLEWTAQFRQTAGDTARHAKDNGAPPEKPMPLPDAQNIVRQILIRRLQIPQQEPGSAPTG
jgi:hypothetical protein